jgi:hypothetical protein
VSGFRPRPIALAAALAAAALGLTGCATSLGPVRPLETREGAVGISLVAERGGLGFAPWAGIGLGGGWDVVVSVPSVTVRRAVGDLAAVGVVLRASPALYDVEYMHVLGPGAAEGGLLVQLHTLSDRGDVGVTGVVGRSPRGLLLAGDFRAEARGDLARDGGPTDLLGLRFGMRRPWSGGPGWTVTFEGIVGASRED